MNDAVQYASLSEGDQETFKQLKEKAIGLLARREHSVRELTVKLGKKSPSNQGEPVDQMLIQNVIQAVQDLGYQSDQRYASALVRSKASSGNGPIKIQQALALKGIDRDLFRQVLDEESIDFYELAADWMARRYTREQLDDYKTSQKSFRYMANRGFNVDQIKYAQEKIRSES